MIRHVLFKPTFSCDITGVSVDHCQGTRVAIGHALTSRTRSKCLYCRLGSETVTAISNICHISFLYSCLISLFVYRFVQYTALIGGRSDKPDCGIPNSRLDSVILQYSTDAGKGLGLALF